MPDRPVGRDGSDWIETPTMAGSLGVRLPLAQAWDGSRWSVVTGPSLGFATNTQVENLDCGTTTSCVAKVSRAYPSADVYEYAVGWDGSQWHELTDGAESASLDAVPYDCAPDGTCLVVNNGWSKTVVWDGDSGTTLNTHPFEDITAVHCFSATSCLATGSSSTYSWNGSAWSYVDGGDTWEIFREGPNAFDCVAPDNCIAAGTNVFETAATSATWDGSVWTEVPLPDGVTSTADVECVGANQCLMLVASGSTIGTLAWLGSWVWAPAPPAGSGGTSCLPEWCMNVGRTGSPWSPTANTYEWTNS